ncbi:hypothetical protein IMCC3135_04465 [Granulosicoccus antarcticus IMCC3135]|uniref:Uncharacterized protein n=2 Tax=Granulosicoccus TaxID=437504 RepID=A0A2Z2NI62_9GAMM|nr:hypothetical protein IMCC3135_04465 [Granulosicoccus antarcticus IMCC3135]
MAVAMMLVLSLVAPKIALSASLLWGDGYRTVVICTGAQLLRVTVSPEGEIISDVTEEWVAPHCVLTDHDVVALQRAWQRADYPQFNREVDVPQVAVAAQPRWFGQAVSSRGPPLG